MNLNISDSIKVSGVSPGNIQKFSRIGLLNLGATDGGELNISTKKLTIADGASIGSAVVLGSGTGSNVNIRATESVEVTGDVQGLLSSSINASTVADGNAGKVTIDTARLNLNNGGDIASATESKGNAGEILINASESVILVSEINDYRSGINTSNLFLNGSQVFFTDASDFPSLDLASSSTGDVGTITVNTPRLEAIGNAYLTVANAGTGKAGDILVNADSIVLDNGAVIVATTASGEGGNISLQVSDSLLLQNGNSINATAKGTGNGGNIQINSDLVVLQENSQITANAVRGNGGNIQINTQGFFVAADSQVTASSDFGLDGTVKVNNLAEEKNLGLIQLSDTTFNPNQTMVTGCRSNKNTLALIGRDGLPENPTQTLRLDNVWLDLRIFEAKATQSNLQLPKPDKSIQESQPQILVKQQIREATGWKVNAQGKIELVATHYKTIEPQKCWQQIQ